MSNIVIVSSGPVPRSTPGLAERGGSGTPRPGRRRSSPGLLYWLMDGGGPLARSKQTARVDFAFTLHVNPGLAAPNWRPVFLDYLDLGFTNATASSPTDVLPLTHRAKYTMLVQSTRCSSTRRTGRRPSRQRVQVGARCPCTAAGGNFASARRRLPRLEPVALRLQEWPVKFIAVSLPMAAHVRVTQLV